MRFAWQLAVALTLATPLAVAQPGGAASAPKAPIGMVDEPCPAAVAMPPAVRDLLSSLFMEPRTLGPTDMAKLTGDKAFGEYNAANRGYPGQDWAGLCRYRAANDALIASGKTPRVIFMGDSITDNWLLGDPALFNDNNVNRGIGGQTTPQMLVRFRNDVVALKPRIVHIMAGTNDVAGNSGPTRVQDFRNNLMSMVDLAKANGIAVILGSIPPAATFNWQPALKPVPRIRELNAWLKSYAASNGLAYIDYYTALTGADGELRSDLGNDGVHPNKTGYAIMRTLLERQLATMAK